MNRIIATTAVVLMLAVIGICAAVLQSSETGAFARRAAKSAAGTAHSVAKPVPRHEVTIRPAPVPRPITTGLKDPLGKDISLECRDCHALRSSNLATRLASDLNEFHQGLTYTHGKLACVACHDPADGYSTLRLADGTALQFADSIQLCAQCHGPQFRDYLRGTHGGMTGYWDLRRGGRTRNHCQHCHDPHAPQYPTVHPVAGPRDRFLPAQESPAHD